MHREPPCPAGFGGGGLAFASSLGFGFVRRSPAALRGTGDAPHRLDVSGVQPSQLQPQPPFGGLVDTARVEVGCPLAAPHCGGWRAKRGRDVCVNPIGYAGLARRNPCRPVGGLADATTGVRRPLRFAGDWPAWA